MLLQVIQLAGLGRVQDVCDKGGLDPQVHRFYNSKNAGARAYVRDGNLISFGQDWNDVPGVDGTSHHRYDKCGEFVLILSSPCSDGSHIFAPVKSDMAACWHLPQG